MRILYVFVEIRLDLQHLVATIRHNFPPSPRLNIVLASTVQFLPDLQVPFVGSTLPMLDRETSSDDGRKRKRKQEKSQKELVLLDECVSCHL